MADINTELAIISQATYGEEVRSAICQALRKINDGGSSATADQMVLGIPVPFIMGRTLLMVFGVATQPESEG